MVFKVKMPIFEWWGWLGVFVSLGLYLPNMVLWYLRRKRQEAIFLTLPDALDLLVVCVESGLGLDAAMRRVVDEMKASRFPLALRYPDLFQAGARAPRTGRPRRA